MIGDRWAAAIGAQRTARWSTMGADRDHPGQHVAIVEFPSYTEAMANSGHPATAAFLKELQSISSSEPQFRNLDVRNDGPTDRRSGRTRWPTFGKLASRSIRGVKPAPRPGRACRRRPSGARRRGPLSRSLRRGRARSARGWPASPSRGREGMGKGGRMVKGPDVLRQRPPCAPRPAVDAGGDDGGVRGHGSRYTLWSGLVPPDPNIRSCQSFRSGSAVTGKVGRAGFRPARVSPDARPHPYHLRVVDTDGHL